MLVCCTAVELPQLHSLELMRLGVRMLPRSLSRLMSLTRLTFSGEMMRSVQLQDELLQLTDLKVCRKGGRNRLSMTEAGVICAGSRSSSLLSAVMQVAPCGQGM